MMTVPEAANMAKHHLVTILPEYSNATFQLEELEAPPYGTKWTFTFSFTLPNSGDTSLASVLRARRISKSVEIDANSGDLLAVKNAAA